MTIYTAKVIETIAVEVRYQIEADSLEEAQAKAEIGDTASESKVRDQGVIDRDVLHIEIDASDASAS